MLCLKIFLTDKDKLILSKKLLIGKNIDRLS